MTSKVNQTISMWFDHETAHLIIAMRHLIYAGNGEPADQTAYDILWHRIVDGDDEKLSKFEACLAHAGAMIDHHGTKTDRYLAALLKVNE